MQLDRAVVYKSAGQRLAWLIHYLKVRFKHKEKNRVLAMSRHFHENSIVIDVGAHFGYLTKEFARAYNGNTNVIAFEPVEYCYSILKRIVRNLPNVKIEKLALFDNESVVKIKIPIKKSGHLGIGLSHFGEEKNRDFISEEIKTITLDSYLEQNHLDRLDFIKIDVEGSELHVLHGAKKTLTIFRPIIYLEIDESMTARMNYQPDDIWLYLSQFNYKSFLMDKNGELSEIQKYSGTNDYLFKFNS